MTNSRSNSTKSLLAELIALETRYIVPVTVAKAANLLTARADFEDHKEFLQTWRDHGFPIDHVYVERSGNLSKLKADSPAHINKGVVLKRYLKTGKYDRVRMWDDHEKNLDILFKVAAMFPEVETIGYLVKDGRVIKYTPKSTSKAIKSVVSEAVKNTKYSIG